MLTNNVERKSTDITKYFHKFNVNTLIKAINKEPRWSACLTTNHEVAGSITSTSTNFKCGLVLERGPPSLVRTIG